MLGKKGVTEEQLFLLIELVLIVFIGASLFAYINSVKSGTLFERVHSAADVALLLNSIQAAPGSVAFNYDEAGGFSYAFSDSTISVYGRDEPTTAPAVVRARHSRDRALAVSATERIFLPDPATNRTTIVITRANGAVVISRELPSPAQFGLASCPPKPELPGLLIDNAGIKGAEFLQKARVNAQLLSPKKSLAERAREIEQSGAALVVLRPEKEISGIAIYINARPSSAALACAAVNAFRQTPALSEQFITINPVDAVGEFALLATEPAIWLAYDSSLELELLSALAGVLRG